MTLNNIISIFKGFAKTHGQINTFFYGDPLKFLNKKDVVYPAMVLFLSDGIKISRKERLTTYPFKIYVIDLLHTINESEDNMADLDSDLSSIAQDIAAMAIDMSKKNVQFNTSGEYSGALLENQFDDLTISFYFDMPIGTLFNSNRCQVPYKGDSDQPVNIINVPLYLPLNNIKNITYKGLGTEGTDITLSSLIEKEILLLFKGDKLLSPVVSDPTPDQYVYDKTIGILSFGNDIEEQQIINLLIKA